MFNMLTSKLQFSILLLYDFSVLQHQPDIESVCMCVNKQKTKKLEKCGPELKLGCEDTCMLCIDCKMEKRIIYGIKKTREVRV